MRWGCAFAAGLAAVGCGGLLDREQGCSDPDPAVVVVVADAAADAQDGGLDDEEPAACYAGRADYRAACQAAGLPRHLAFDASCISSPAKPGSPVGYGGGGVPFLSTGFVDWNVHLYRLDCRTIRARDGAEIICCPEE